MCDRALRQFFIAGHNAAKYETATNIVYVGVIAKSRLGFFLIIALVRR